MKNKLNITLAILILAILAFGQAAFGTVTGPIALPFHDLDDPSTTVRFSISN